MRGSAAAVAAAVVALAAQAANAAPYSSPRDDEFDRKVQAEIEARDPEGAVIFAKATAARDAHDEQAAGELLEQVHARDPWFLHATRRLCGVESRRGHHERAIALCREAYAADASAENGAALAMALLLADQGTSDNGSKALELASAAARKAPRNFYAQFVYCEAALHMKDFRDASWCSSAMRLIAPHDALALYYSAIAEGNQGKMDEARRDLEEAHANGLPEAQYGPLHDAIEGTRSPIERWAPAVGKALAGWLAGFVLLLGLGALLSAAAVRAARRVPTVATGHARGLDAWLRRLYRGVLWLVCAYYYVSLPIVALLAVGMAAATFYACMTMGVLPIRILVIVFFIVVVSLGAIWRSLTASNKDEAPGEELDLTSHPKLRLVLDEVAARIGTRPVDTVYVTPGTDIAVLERGVLSKQLRRKGERCLVLGAGVLDGMRIGELKSILAHEYGHFHNEDTAGGGFALAVRRSLATMVMHMVQGGGTRLFSPAWWFIKTFEGVFLRVSQGASRLQEVLADRWAAFAYGSDAFESGLRHVVQRSVRFDAHVTATLREVVPAKQPLANLYTYAPKKEADRKNVDEALDMAMNGESPYDSHPRPADRIAWVRKIAAPAPTGGGGEEDAWSLLSDREAIERRMTEEMRSRLAKRGIVVKADAAAAVAPASP